MRKLYFIFILFRSLVHLQVFFMGRGAHPVATLKDLVQMNKIFYLETSS